ncbi:hypothetical protein GCM10007857_89710 [Bradyrhizobium iriomotense]|uniref:Uncharacterized protein n=1 Tax=Bradyrhizobium iriomotense TaxID=441950 RepID=A0ABQ6BCX8_9BRAD|nr:hypothetical protein GCM10007857_89710 [Bradyrhizobium iriomotense]
MHCTGIVKDPRVTLKLAALFDVCYTYEANGVGKVADDLSNTGILRGETRTRQLFLRIRPNSDDHS